MGPDVCSSCLSPSRLERQLAARLVGGLVRLIAEAPVPPEKVVNHRGVRKALKWPSDFPEDIEMPDDSPSSF
ncbi:unnamed protein product [Protopolystoma xenopodis]|uniref:Uncharacterized protein n=1 Tax=Protopolystoma xenopodis TaxID=117903 RepID=A0A3S5BUI8_9PLAT|nr:unnamed protein product [Protopolystoma xenopodis]